MVLTVCKVLPDVVAVVMTMVDGVVNCIAIILTIGLAGFMTSLDTCGCDVVVVVVATVDSTGSTMLTVAGVLAIMVTAVEVADAVMAGTVA